MPLFGLSERANVWWIPFFVLCLALAPLTSCGQNVPQISKDSDMEDRINKAWADVRDYGKQLENDVGTKAEDPKWQFAKEFFDYFLENPGTPTGKKAGQSAFMMWGNLGAVEEIERAIQHVTKESELWRPILNSIGNAYGKRDRGQEYVDLLHRLEDELTDPGSRSELMLRLARQLHSQKQPSKEKAYLEEVLALGAHPFDVQKAESELYELASLTVGQAAPDFKVETIDGKVISLSEFRGKYVLLEFWAMSCGPCLPEIPHLKALEKDLPRSDFQIIGISNDKDLEALRRFLKDREVSWPQIQQVSAFEGETLKQDEILGLYNVFWFPRSFLIDREGIITAKDLRGDQLETEVRKLVMDTVEGKTHLQSEGVGA